MNWYYVEAGQQAGPIDENALQQMAASGRITADTLVWHEGMTEWQPYSQASGSAHAAPPPPIGLAPDHVACAECGRVFNRQETISYGTVNVCAACKPVFLQKLAEGAPVTAPGMGFAATEADILARDYEVDIGACLSHGWETFKANAGIMIGVSVLVYFLMFAASAILGLIPLPGINSLLSILISAPLIGGLWFFYIKLIRREPAAVADAFSGFGPRYWQLVLANLMPMLVIFAFVFVIVLGIMLGAFSMGRGQSSSSIGTAAMAVLVVVGLIVFLAVMYLSICWTFSIPLVADKGLKFWPAMELSRRVVNKHWWMTFALLFVIGFVAVLGVLACGLGMLVTAPVAFAGLTTHYQRVFGDLAPRS